MTQPTTTARRPLTRDEVDALPLPEQLRAAADVLDELIDATPPGPLTQDGRYGALLAPPTPYFPEDGGYAGHVVAESMTARSAALVAGVWGPGARLLAHVLRDAAPYVAGPYVRGDERQLLVETSRNVLHAYADADIPD